MGSGFSKKKKQARMLQEQFSQLQDQLKDTEVEGSAGAGLVTIKLNGEHQIISLAIKPECVDPEDVEGLEDLIRAAHNDALDQLQGQAMPSLGGLMGGGSGMPF